MVEPNAVAWRYQRKEGWGDIWRVSTVPVGPADFDRPDDWTVQPLGVLADAQCVPNRVADWLDDQARIATNSLHCGDNSLTIQRTHAWAAELEAAARRLRADAPALTEGNVAQEAGMAELKTALEPFLRVAKVMDFYIEESMPDMTYPRPECESRYPDEPRCQTLNVSDFARLAQAAAALTEGAYEKCPTCDGHGLALNMAGESDTCPECKGNTVVSPLPEGDAVSPVPAGWKLVPEQPTQVQMNAGLYQASHDASYADVYSIYLEMVRAGPAPDDHPVAREPARVPRSLSSTERK